MVIDMIEKIYIENREQGLAHVQRYNLLEKFIKIDKKILRYLEQKDFDKVLEQLDEMCYLLVLIEDEEKILNALEIYYISILTMQMRNMIDKDVATDIYLSNIYSLMTVVKKWKELKDYLHFTPWFVTKIKELQQESVLPLHLNYNVYQAIHIIKNELNNPKLSTAFIAEKLGISKSHLCYLFKQDFNDSLTKTIRKFRLKHAVIDIQSSNLSLHEITIKYGFKSPSYFSRIFKEHYGFSPMEYRKRQLR